MALQRYENTLQQNQLYFKSLKVRNLGCTDVIVADIDTAIKNTTSVLNESEIKNMRHIIALCNKLGTKLILTTKLKQNIAEKIGRKVFDQNYNVDMMIFKYGNTKRYFPIFRLVRYLQYNHQSKHIFFVNRIDVNQKLTFLQEMRKVFCVVFISHGIEDALCLTQSTTDIGIALGSHSTSCSDLEQEKCSVLCNANNPLKAILESIEADRNCTKYCCNWKECMLMCYQ